MTLEIQIATFGHDGIERVSQMQLPNIDNVIYTICLQYSSENPPHIPPSLIKPYIRILPHKSVGISNNRNFGLDNAVGDIILFADDDLVFDSKGIASVVNVFENNPDINFATFIHTGPDLKKFPRHSFDFKLNEAPPKGYYLTSFELAIRRSALPHELRFPTQFGIGAPFFGAGEESIFHLNLLKAGLKGRFFPINIATHPTLTTGMRKPTASFLHAQGAWLRIRYGCFEGFLRLLRDIPRRKSNPFFVFYHLFLGFLKAPR